MIQIYRCTCDCLCTPLGFILYTRWVASYNPWACMSSSRSLELVDHFVKIRVAQRKH